MLLINPSRSWDRWPKVREYPDGSVTVHGTCQTLRTWLWLRYTGIAMSLLIGALLLLTASAGLWIQSSFDTTEGTAMYGHLTRIVRVRMLMHELLVERYPGLGSSIWYDSRRPLDLHLAVLGLVLVMGRGAAASVWCASISAVAGRIVRSTFRVHITPERVKVVRGLSRWTVARGHGALDTISFRSAPLGEVFPHLAPEKLEQHRTLHSLHRLPAGVLIAESPAAKRVILVARRADRSEAIASKCNELLSRSDPTVSFLNP